MIMLKCGVKRNCGMFITGSDKSEWAGFEPPFQFW